MIKVSTLLELIEAGNNNEDIEVVGDIDCHGAKVGFKKNIYVPSGSCLRNLNSYQIHD